jgi:hypothetical protein
MPSRIIFFEIASSIEGAGFEKPVAEVDESTSQVQIVGEPSFLQAGSGPNDVLAFMVSIGDGDLVSRGYHINGRIVR